MREAGETGEAPPWREEPLSEGACLVDGPSRLMDFADAPTPILAHARRPGELSQVYVVRRGAVVRVPRPWNPRPDILPPSMGNDWVTLSESLRVEGVRGYFLCAAHALPATVTLGALARRLGGNALDGSANGVFSILARWSVDPDAHADDVERLLASLQRGILAYDVGTPKLRINPGEFPVRQQAAVDMALFMAIRARFPSCDGGYWNEISLAAGRMGLPETWLAQALPVDTVAATLAQ